METKVLKNSEVLKYLRETEENGGKQSYSGLNSNTRSKKIRVNESHFVSKISERMGEYF